MSLLLLLACSTPKPIGPNVLLVTVDTLRADHLGAYGYERPTSPAIDALARTGVLFERVVSPRGATWPALASLLSSTYPVEHGARMNLVHALPSATLLSEVLQAKGYTTAAFLTNSADAEWEGFPPSDGFTVEPRDHAAVDAAIEWLATAPTPYFAWVHLMAPHDPYVDHPDGPPFLDPDYAGPIDATQGPLIRGMFGRPPFTDADHAAIIARYDGEVAAADAEVGRLLAAVQDGPRAKDVLVVFSADHGEELGEHPPYLFHFGSAYDGVLHVPLILSQPGALPEERKVKLQISLIDVAPTVLELLAIDPPEGWRGRSVATAIGGAPLPERAVHAELDRGVQVVYRGDTVYLRARPGYATDLASPLQRADAGVDVPDYANRYPYPDEALWNLATDPHQQQNLVATNPPALAAIRTEAERFRNATGWPGPERVQAPSLPNPQREALERMGYLSPDAPVEKPPPVPPPPVPPSP